MHTASVARVWCSSDVMCVSSWMDDGMCLVQAAPQGLANLLHVYQYQDRLDR